MHTPEQIVSQLRITLRSIAFTDGSWGERIQLQRPYRWRSVMRNLSESIWPERPCVSANSSEGALTPNWHRVGIRKSADGRSCAMALIPMFCFLLSSVYAAGVDTRSILPLDTDDWQLTRCAVDQGEKSGMPVQPSSEFPSIRVSVPNDVHSTSFVKDPLGQSPDVVDVNNSEWWYTRKFQTPTISSGRQVRLIFDGVDYFADVWLNGTKLGSHEGAFTRFEFDISDLIAKGENYIAVRVRSPWKVPGRSHYEFMKGGYEENWDALPGPGQVVFPLGLHRGVRLEITSFTRVEDLHVWTTSLKDGVAELRSSIHLLTRRGAAAGTIRVSIKPENFTGPAIPIPSRAFSVAESSNDGTQVDFNIEVKDPHLWWTWDLGPQNLYRAEVVLLDQSGSVLDSISTVFGIRTVERNSNLLYRINGRQVFVRGSWYAMSSLYTAATGRWTYEKDLRLARNANMNSLVTYTVIEKDEFYDLADRLGMLLFIELPFNQQGPMDALNKNNARRREFIEWSSGEVRQIVRNLRNHPSVGLWGPLSEVTTDGVEFGGSPKIVEAADGYAMFLKAIKGVVETEDPNALYHPSFCDFGEKHFWEGGLVNGSTYDQQFDESASFISEYGALGAFPYEDAARATDVNKLWNDAPGNWSPYRASIRVKDFSYALPWQYTGMDLNMAFIGSVITRHLDSFRDYINASQIYQSVLYGYAGDAYRRKIFNPINGVRSWMLKSFPEVPVGGYGVVDAFGSPLPAYYDQRRTFSPLTMSFAIRNPIESVSGGSELKVPIWISNIGGDKRDDLSIDYTLYDLSGKTLQSGKATTSVPAYRAEEVATASIRLPVEAGIYILRGQVRETGQEIAHASSFVKVAPPATRRSLRVLVIGSPEWAMPVADFLRGFGAKVTTALDEETVVRPPHFPASAMDIKRDYDMIWLAGYANYWREAPGALSSTMLAAVRDGVTFVHSGSMASYHGGGDNTAALDLTQLAEMLPVTVKHENDVYLKSTNRAGNAPNAFVSQEKYQLSATDNAPLWLRNVALSNLAPESFHMLEAKAGSEILLRLNNLPMLAGGRYGKGKTIAYMGFGPQDDVGAKHKPIILDRAIVESPQGHLFAIVSAAILALAAEENPPVSIEETIEDRARPLFENLLAMKPAEGPLVSATWTHDGDGHPVGHVRIKNGNEFTLKLRVRLTGSDVQSGRILQLWSDQYFDLLPHEVVETMVTLLKADTRRSAPLAIMVEAPSIKEGSEHPGGFGRKCFILVTEDYSRRSTQACSPGQAAARHGLKVVCRLLITKPRLSTRLK